MGAEKLVVMVALLVLAGATPLAQGQLIQKAIINGAVCCSSTGGCTPGAPPLVGANVSLNCITLFGNVATLVQNVTTATGLFSLNVNNLPTALVTILGGILPCRVVVRLPLNSTVCPILSTVNGTLSALPVLASTVGSLLGGLLTGVFSALNFTYVAVTVGL